MPIIKAFQGKIIVEGRSRGAENAEPFYTWTLTAYGETIGELLDNLVTTSISVANDVFAWVANNKPADYELKDDYWYIQLIHPDILETHKADTKTSEQKDTASSSTLNTVDFIVKFPTLIRDIQIKSVTTLLLLTKSGESEIIDSAANPLNGMYEVTSFSEMAKFGFTGAELDTILEIGEREGRVKSHLADKQLLRNYRSVGKLPSTADEPKKRWWKRSLVRD